MKASNFPEITIPNPCHEDWNKMTPDERGAYCAVCSKSVWDFTDKSPDEVKNILMQESEGKLCGRFRQDQLAQPVELEIPLYMLKGRHLSRLARFAIAALVVFGTTLFSFTTTQGQIVGKVRIQKEPQTMVYGEVAIRDIAPTPAAEDSIQTEHPLIGDTVAIPVVCDLLGDIFIAPELPNDTLPERDSDSATIKSTLPKPNLEIKGFISSVAGMVSFDVPQDGNQRKLKKKGRFHKDLMSNAQEQIDTSSINEETAVVQPPNSLNETNKSPANPTEDNFPSGNNGTVNVFPNPASDLLNITYLIQRKARVTIEVYDLNGKLLQRLARGEHHETGEYTRAFNVASLPSGAYLCMVKTGDTSQTVRFVKSE